MSNEICSYKKSDDIVIYCKDSDVKKINCSDLNPNDIVVFYVDVYHEGKKSVYDGNVISINKHNKTVSVVYLEGYHSRNDDIPFEDMLAKADENGLEMLFGGWIRGRSALLNPV